MEATFNHIMYLGTISNDCCVVSGKAFVTNFAVSCDLRLASFRKVNRMKQLLHVSEDCRAFTATNEIVRSSEGNSSKCVYDGRLVDSNSKWVAKILR